MSLEVDQVFGHYRVLERLGVGGMGEVYRARDLSLGREVALKVLPAELAGNSERMKRLKREARLLASLNHANIAQIYSVESVGSHNVLVLELVEGEDVATRLARGPLPLKETVALCTRIAEALECAHEAGIIHRDLKPDNVRISARGSVKLLDFGLARFVSRADSGKAIEGAGSLSSLTREGMLIGTPVYMSPEAFSGGAVDRRTDIWAFG